MTENSSNQPIRKEWTEKERVFPCLLAREFQVFESHANFYLKWER